MPIVGCGMVAGAIVAGTGEAAVVPVTLLPSAPTTHQMPPANPSPFTSPGALSFTNRYSGWPPYSTCWPLAPFTTPTFDPSSPVPATGAAPALGTTGTQMDVQAPVHVAMVAESLSSW